MFTSIFADMTRQFSNLPIFRLYPAAESTKTVFHDRKW